MITFDLIDYPKFYSAFRNAMDAELGSHWQVLTQSTDCKRVMKSVFGHTVEITANSKLWLVDMDEKEYTMFALKWL